MIVFKDVTKIYKLYKGDRQMIMHMLFRNTKIKEKRALSNVSFVIDKGESVAFFGKNGAGKSTILKMITEVCYPTSGDVTVEGSVSALLGLTAGFDQEFTGRENIYLKGQIIGMSEKQIKVLEKDIIDFAEIGEAYIDQPIRTYSNGMRARLGFAISVNTDPDILIVDEALSVGDEQFKNKCRVKVAEIMRKEDITFLFVTHSPETAREFCSRGIVLEQGNIVFDGEIGDAIACYDGMVRVPG